MARQYASRASSGCADCSAAGVVAGLMAGEAVVREARSVSCRPGAEGAPAVRALDGFCSVRFVVEVGWAEEGAMRRAWARGGELVVGVTWEA